MADFSESRSGGAAETDRSIKTMIRLLDLISLAGIKLGDYKIHCATGVDPTPLEAFFDGQFKQWQEYQNQQNFRCDHIISLIHLGADRWFLLESTLCWV